MPRATIRLSLQYKHSPFLQFISQTHLESINSNSTPLFLFPLSSTLNPFLTRPSHVTRMSLSGCCLTGAIQKRMQEKVQHKRSFVWLVRNETPVSSHLCSSQEFRLFLGGWLKSEHSCSLSSALLCPEGLDSRAPSHSHLWIYRAKQCPPLHYSHSSRYNLLSLCGNNVNLPHQRKQQDFI